MIYSRKLRFCLLSILLASLLYVPIGPVQAQNVPHITVTITGQNLTAGFSNNVTVSVLNGYYTAIYDVDVALSVPSGLALYGDSHWHYDSLQLGQGVRIAFQLYAPTAAIGSTYPSSVTLNYKQLGDVSYTQEVHAVSFSVKGWISLIMYGVQLTPPATTPGGNTTISGNLLNGGNLAAYNANVTVESNIVVPSSLSNAFLGEVDPNIPRPFSLVVVFRSDAPIGNYTLVVKATAIDQGRPGSPYSAQANARVQLRRATGTTLPRGGAGGGGIIGLLIEILRYLQAVFFGSTSPFALAVPLATDFVRAMSRRVYSFVL